jgi:Ser/Thr protein kinase RdoA (MazF antagonist)
MAKRTAILRSEREAWRFFGANVENKNTLERENRHSRVGRNLNGIVLLHHSRRSNEPKLSDLAHWTRGLQPERDDRVRWSAWLGRLLE